MSTEQHGPDDGRDRQGMAPDGREPLAAEIQRIWDDLEGIAHRVDAARRDDADRRDADEPDRRGPGDAQTEQREPYDADPGDHDGADPRTHDGHDLAS